MKIKRKKEGVVMKNLPSSFRVIGLLFFGLIFMSSSVFATASTQIWNPSTDIQALGTVHLGIDNYFMTLWPQNGAVSVPVDIGLTYGLLPGLEVGIDGFYPSSTQYKLNAKYGIAENGNMPAFAVGGYNFGFDTKGSGFSADENIAYALVAKTFSLGRLSAGYYAGNEKVLLSLDGDAANTGYILTWDKALTDKIWACVDYSTGYSAYGALFYGFSYLFSQNTSIIFGYGTFNGHQNTGDGLDPVFTTQLDINI
jgi:hypothetical protein